MLLTWELIASSLFCAHLTLRLQFRAGGKAVAVYLDREGDVTQQLTEAKTKSAKEGVPIRALIITNPDNPTGTLLPESTLTAIATWCADQELHLIA